MRRWFLLLVAVALVLALAAVGTGCQDDSAAPVPSPSSPSTSVPPSPPGSASVVPGTRARTPPPGDGGTAFTVRLSGPAEVGFRGTLTTTPASGSPVAQAVEGTVPAAYTVSGRSITLTLQHTGHGGILTVDVLKNGMVVQTSQTSAGGTITLSSQ